MNKTILVVEDSRTQAMLLENILERHGYCVAIATDGEEALQWLSEHKPLLVISDIVMPRMNGYELCRKVKTKKSTKNIPVILLTSLNGTEEVIEGLVAGADSFITKPYDLDYLISHIEKILADQSGVDTEKESFGVEILFEGKKRTIQSDQQQTIKLLLNIYEGSIQQNKKLLESQENLRILNENLESLVNERTEKLESQHALLRALINSPSDIFIFSLDTSYCYTTFNENHRREMKRIWNVDIQAGTNLLECMSNTQLSEIAKMSIDYALNGEHLTEIQHQPEVDTYYELNWNPIIQNNEVMGVTVFINDISDRKRTELKTIENENFIKTITAEVQEVIFAIDAKGIFTFSEGKGLRKLGLEPGQVVGMSVFEVYKDYPEIVQACKSSLNGQEIKIIGLEVAHLNYDTTFQPIFDKDGKVTSVVGLSIDVTEEKKAEEEIKRKNDELLKVNAEKDKFFSIIAHDLRSPLSSFLGLTELMDEDLPNMKIEDLKEIAASMKVSAENLYRLLENLLQWAKIQRGLVPFDPEVVSLFQIVNEALAIVRESAINKNITVKFDIPDHLEVFADINMLQTVIRNLISNAVKFTRKGGEININSQIADAGNVEISICDTGIGMSPEMLSTLFEISNKSGRKGTEGEPSSGLGLILCKEFIEKLGGRILVESEVGVGSKFSFTIPLNGIPEQTESVEDQSELIKAGGLNVLIADDDESSGRLAALIVKSIAAKVICVKNGMEEVKAFRENPNIDLIITDIQMPEMNGYEAVKQIRQLNDKVIIIAMTDFAQTGEKEIAQEAGCNDYVSKPIKRDQLMGLMQKYFKK